MSIAINKALCKGCTACAKVCPGSLIKMDDDKKAYMQVPERLLGMLILYQRVPVWRDRSLPGSRYWRYGKQDDCTFGRKSVILEHITKRWQQRTGYYQQKRIK